MPVRVERVADGRAERLEPELRQDRVEIDLERLQQRGSGFGAEVLGDVGGRFGHRERELRDRVDCQLQPVLGFHQCVAGVSFDLGSDAALDVGQCRVVLGGPLAVSVDLPAESVGLPADGVDRRVLRGQSGVDRSRPLAQRTDPVRGGDGNRVGRCQAAVDASRRAETVVCW